MDYWAETMQDDCYLIAADGWKAETYRIIEKDKKGKEKDKGWTCDLVPKALIVARYFAKEQEAIDQARSRTGKRHRPDSTELEEEHGGEEGAFSELDKVNKANVTARLKEIKGDKEAKDEAAVLNDWLKLNDEEADLKKRLKEAEAELDAKAYAKYPEAHRGRDQDAGGGRQMARRARCRHPRRDGPRQPGTHPAREGTGRTLRNPAAADGQPRGRAGGQGEPPSGKDGVLMEVKPGYKQTEVGVIPEDWEVTPLGRLLHRLDHGGFASMPIRYVEIGTPYHPHGNLQRWQITWTISMFMTIESDDSAKHRAAIRRRSVQSDDID